MATDKKSFLLYCDLIHVVGKLSNEQAGTLFKLIIDYVNDLNPDIESYDILTQIAFEPIRLQLNRDLVKWDEFKSKQSENGKKGGRPKKEIEELDEEENPKNPSLFEESQKSLTVTVSDTVTVNDTNKSNNTKEEDVFLARDHLSITWGEMNKLIDKYGEIVANDTVNRVLNYRKNSKYKSLYLTALLWIQKDKLKKQTETDNGRKKSNLAV